MIAKGVTPVPSNDGRFSQVENADNINRQLLINVAEYICWLLLSLTTKVDGNLLVLSPYLLNWKNISAKNVT